MTSTSPRNQASTRNSYGNWPPGRIWLMPPTCCSSDHQESEKPCWRSSSDGAAVDTGHKVYYTTAADLAARCRKAALQGRWAQDHAVLQHPESVDHRRTGLSPHAGRRRRHTVPSDLTAATGKDRSSSPQTSAVTSWGEIFSDHTIAAAMLDRLLHKSVVFTITGDSYRLQKLPSTSQKTPIERRPTSLKPPNPEWGISAIDSGELPVIAITRIRGGCG